MRPRVGIGPVMAGVAAVAVGLAAATEWRKAARRGPSASARIARAALADRAARQSGPGFPIDPATLVAGLVAAVAASKLVRATAGGRNHQGAAPTGR